MNIVYPRCTEEELAGQLKRQDFRVREIQFLRTKNAKFTGTARLVFDEESDAFRACTFGVRVGYYKRLAVMWRVHQRTQRCFNCQGRGHMAGSCTNERKCVRCAGNHGLAECRSSVLRCANCGKGHQAWNDMCEFAIRARQLASYELGYTDKPPPNRPAVRSVVAVPSHVQGGISFASAAGGSPQSLPSDSGVDPASSRIEELQVKVDRMCDAVTKLFNVFDMIVKAVERVQSRSRSSGSGKGAVSPRAAANPLQDLVSSILIALQEVMGAAGVSQGSNSGGDG